MDALRAENARLQELISIKDQLLTSREHLLASKDQLLISKDAQLAMKDELLAAKDQLLLTSKGASARTAEGLQQYEDLAQHSDESAKRQRLLSSTSSFETASPLDKDEVLDQVFSYVGGGDHLFVAGVSSRWRRRYLQYCALNSTSKQDEVFATRHRSALVRERTLRVALTSGLSVKGWTMDKESCTELICHSSEPEKVMTLLRVHGVPWDWRLCRRAAERGSLRFLQWLRSTSCPWKEAAVLHNACKSGNVAMLQWLLTATAPWTDTVKQEMLQRAAWYDRLAAVQWLKAHGAQWPANFGGQYKVRDEQVQQCWSLSAVQWAIASGSGWLQWKCEGYHADQYRYKSDKKQATDVLKWAHANGCPCTCGHHQQQQQQQQQ
jgi:hypothetical protein